MYVIVLLLAAAINFSTAISSIAVGLGFAYILYKIFRTKTLPNINREYLWIFGFYFLCQFFIAMLSIQPPISFREFAAEIHRCFPFFFALLFVRNKYELRNVLIVILFCNIIDDFMGCYQKFFLGMDRPPAFNKSPTFFGSFLLMQFPTEIFIACLPIMPTWARKLSIFACVLTIFSLGISFTRGAWLAFIFVVIVFMFVEKNYRKLALKFSAVFLSAAMIFFVVSPTAQNRLATLTDTKFQSNSERILMWQSAVEMFKDYPIHGAGQKMFFELYNHKYISPDAKERETPDKPGHTHPHNNFLKAATEGGILGLIAFITLHGYFLYEFYKIYRNEETKLKFSAAMTAFLILVGLLAEGMTDTNMNQVPIMREYWLLAGLMLTARRLETEGRM